MERWIGPDSLQKAHTARGAGGNRAWTYHYRDGFELHVCAEVQAFKCPNTSNHMTDFPNIDPSDDERVYSSLPCDAMQPSILV